MIQLTAISQTASGRKRSRGSDLHELLFSSKMGKRLIREVHICSPLLRYERIQTQVNRFEIRY